MRAKQLSEKGKGPRSGAVVCHGVGRMAATQPQMEGKEVNER